MISISDAEAQVMEVLWQAGQQSTEDIALVLADRQDIEIAIR